MQAKRITGLVAVLALLGAAAVPGALVAQDEAGYQLEIGLPADSPQARVEARGEALHIVLPVQADYPADLSSASAGLLGPAIVELLGDGRVSMRVPMNGSRLGKVDFDSRRLRIAISPLSSFAASGDAAGDTQYRLGPDDKITLTVHNDPDLNRVPLTVTKDGTVSAPLVGEVRAQGFTVRELGAELASRLDEFIVDPQVDVSVDEYNSQWAMVMGEVRRPGRVPLKGGTTLKEVLGDAQGFSDTAGEVIHLSRKQSQGDPSETIRRAQFESGVNNPVLSHGDIVTVGRATYCYVQGEVRSPGRVQIERGMTLLRAITMVGGLTEWAKEKSVIVLSEDESGEEREFNLKAIRNGRAEDPPLYGGEVVVVKKRVL